MYYRLQMSVPGGSIGFPGLTWVSVSPTHRRRGILRELLTRLRAKWADEGHAVAALWASGAPSTKGSASGRRCSPSPSASTGRRPCAYRRRRSHPCASSTPPNSPFSHRRCTSGGGGSIRESWRATRCGGRPNSTTGRRAGCPRSASGTPSCTRTAMRPTGSIRPTAASCRSRGSKKSSRSPRGPHRAVARVGGAGPGGVDDGHSRRRGPASVQVDRPARGVGDSSPRHPVGRGPRRARRPGRADRRRRSRRRARRR